MQQPSSPGAQPLILTADRDLRDELQELCAAAGLPVDVVSEAAHVRQCWSAATAVLVGEDLAEVVSTLRVTRRSRVVVVTQAADSASMWRVAVALGADDVMTLPGARPRLSSWLSELSDGTGMARTIAVTGGCGGAGASVLAAAMSMTTARQGWSTLLIDADPIGGGIELALGCEHLSGLRWPEVAATRGRVSGAAFRAALPSIGELAVLSWGRSGPGQVLPDVMATMVRAGQRGSQVVVVDLPRRLDSATSEALTLCDLALLVVPAELRAIASSQAMLSTLRGLCADIRLVVRAIRGSGLSAQTVADALPLPFAGTVPTRHGVAKSINDGVGPGGRGGFDAATRRLVHETVGAPGVAG